MRKAVALKQPGQLAQATHWKPQLCLCLHCTKEAGLLYTRGSSFSKGVHNNTYIHNYTYIYIYIYIYIQPPSNRLCMHSHQLVPTTIIMTFTQICQFTGVEVDIRNYWTIFNATNYVCMTFILFVCDSVLSTYVYYVYYLLSCRNALKVVHMYSRHHGRTF